MSRRTNILESMAKNVEALGPWLAASIDDPKACDEYVAAGRRVLDSLQALRELASVPPFPWSDFPKAAWVARDKDGAWFAYSERPELGTDQWMVGGTVVGWWHGPGAPDWRESLQQRPE